MITATLVEGDLIATDNGERSPVAGPNEWARGL